MVEDNDPPLGLRAVAALALGCVVWAPILADGTEVGGAGDWQMIYHNLEAALAALHAGELPLWDPFHCGGVTSLGNPESTHFAPWTLLLAIVFGSVAAVKILLVLHTAIGALGMYTMGRVHGGVSPVPAAMAAVAWSASGFFVMHMHAGHFTFAPYYLLPWLWITWWRALHDPFRSVEPAAILAIMLFEGGTYPLPHAALLVGFQTLLFLAGGMRLAGASRWRWFGPGSPRRRAVGTAIVSMVCISGLFALLGALRWLPVIETLRLYPRTLTSTDTSTIAELASAWVTRDAPWTDHHLYGWHEYGSYVGWPVVVLAVAGALHAARRHPALILGTALFLLLAMGSVSPWAPWSVMRTLPVFDSLRVPSRFQCIITFFVTLLAANGLERVRHLGQGQVRDAARVLAAGAACLAMAVVLGEATDVNATRGPVPPAAYSGTAFHMASVNYNHEFSSLPRQNRGTPICYVGGMKWAISPALEMGEVPQFTVEGGRVTSIEQGVAEVVIELESNGGRGILNMNYHPDWVSSHGPVIEDAGRLAVDVPPGVIQLTLRYEPPSFARGCAGTGLGVILCTAMVLLRRRRLA